MTSGFRRRFNLLIPLLGETGPSERLSIPPLTLFPSRVEKHLIVIEGSLTASQHNSLAAHPGIHRLTLPRHSGGVGETVLRAARHLPLAGGYFLCRPDIQWKWEFRSLRREWDQDALVFVSRQNGSPEAIGLYYFRRGYEMMQALSLLKAERTTESEEISLDALCPRLAALGKKTGVVEVRGWKNLSDTRPSVDNRQLA